MTQSFETLNSKTTEVTGGRLKSEVKSTKNTTSSNLPTKEIHLESEESMNGGTCSESRIQCVHARVATCACFPFLLIGFRKSTVAVEYTLHHEISQLEYLCLVPLPTGSSSFSLHLHRLYRVYTSGESTDLFKRRSRREATGFVTAGKNRSGRFSIPVFTSIFTLDFCLYQYMCQFIF